MGILYPIILANIAGLYFKQKCASDRKQIN